MLNRRQLRIKVMEALYAFFAGSGSKKDKLSELLTAFESISELGIFLLLLLKEIKIYANHRIDKAKTKYLPTGDDLSPNTRFINNGIWQILEHDEKLAKTAAKLKFSWKEEEELVKNIYLAIKAGNEYAAYINSPDDSFDNDRKFAMDIYRKYILSNEWLSQFLSEKNLHWAVNLDFAHKIVLEVMEGSYPAMLSRPELNIIPDTILSREDALFITNLFTKTIENNVTYEKWIGDKAKNWEKERIAAMDILLMKMALCEILEFSTIPVKVSLNEYIEISKMYSAPQSGGFINGILDSIVADLHTQKKIAKQGRGLIDS